MLPLVPLLRVTLQHAYFNADRSPHWRFEPLAESQQIERELGLRRQPESGGMMWWRESHPGRDVALAAAAGTRTLRLQYAVFCDEPGWHGATDWPATPPVCYHLPWEGGEVQVTASAAVGGAGLLQACFMIELLLPEAAIWQAGAGSKVKDYRIEMRAAALHWKYFFGGALAQKKLAIVDLDAGFMQAAGGDAGQGSAAAEIRFIASPKTAGAGSAAWVSDQPIALRQVPPQRFQLQEADGLAGQGGRVLIKRLPNASVKKIGKETGSDGKDMLVAEIYIHQ